jgi:hypothetical protein
MVEKKLDFNRYSKIINTTVCRFSNYTGSSIPAQEFSPPQQAVSAVGLCKFK